MKSIIFTSLTLFTSTFAQVTYDTTTNAIICPADGGKFCGGPSLSSPILISCQNSVATLSNCADTLSNALAVCSQISPSAGSAVCVPGPITAMGRPPPVDSSSSSSMDSSTPTTTFQTLYSSSVPTTSANSLPYSVSLLILNPPMSTMSTASTISTITGTGSGYAPTQTGGNNSTSLSYKPSATATTAAIFTGAAGKVGGNFRLALGVVAGLAVLI